MEQVQGHVVELQSQFDLEVSNPIQFSRRAYNSFVDRFNSLPLFFGINHFGPLLNFGVRMELTKNILRLTLTNQTSTKGIKRNVADHRAHRLRVVNHL